MNSGGQGHGLVSLVPLGSIVLPLEGDAGSIEAKETAVGNRDTVGITRQVGEHRFRPTEGRLGVDHPPDLAQGREIAPIPDQ